MIVSDTIYVADLENIIVKPGGELILEQGAMIKLEERNMK